MPELKRFFTSGRMNKDLDERLLPNGEYRDALNIQIANSEGANIGAIENIPGNLGIYNNIYNEGTNTFTEWDLATSDLNKYGLNTNTAQTIGVIRDTENKKIYWFVTASNMDAIIEYDQIINVVSPILVDKNNVLNFSTDYLITGINIIDGLLFFTDDNSEPKKINIDKFKTASNATGFSAHTQIYGRDFIEEDVVVIKKYPLKDLTYEAKTSLRDGVVESVLVHDFTTTDDDGEIIPLPTTTDPFVVTFSGLPDFKTNDIIILTLDDENIGTEDETVIRVLITGDEGLAENEFEIKIQAVPGELSASNDRYKAVLETPEPPFQFKFPRFSYRYKYADGEYSAFGPFTPVIFKADSFSYDAKKGYNLGMINQVRLITLSNFIDSNISSEIIEVDILYKESVNTNVYTVQTVKKDDAVWSANSYDIGSELIYKTVEANQILRPYDNVPRKAKAQEITANRIVYANYLQNYDYINLDGTELTPKFDVAITSSNIEVVDGIAEFSIKTQRNYQLGVVYLDKFGRQSPIFTDISGSKKLNKSLSSTYNKIIAKTLSNYPSWATHFKYYIKEPSNEYYNIAMDRYYNAEDGNVWISFPSSERNKITDETFLELKKEHNTGTPIKTPAKYKVLSIENEAPDFIKEKFVSKGSVQTNFEDGIVPQKDFAYIELTKEDFDQAFEGIIGESNLYVRINDSSNISDKVSISSIITKTNGNSDDTVRISLEEKLNETVNFAQASANSGTNELFLEIFKKITESKPEFGGRFFVKLNKDNILEESLERELGEENYSIKYQRGFLWTERGNRSNDYWIPRGGWTIFEAIPDAIRPWPSFAYDVHNAEKKGKGINPGQKTISIAYIGGDGGEKRGRGTWKDKKNAFTSWGLKGNSVDQLVIRNFIQNIGNKFRFKNDPTEPKPIYEIKNVKQYAMNLYDGDGSQRGKFESSRALRWDLTLDKEIQWSPTSLMTSNSSDRDQEQEIEFLRIYDEDAKAFSSENPGIFETEPAEDLNLDLYYAASEAFPIAEHGNEKTLNWYNCISFGNGVESNRIRDDYNAPTIDKGPIVSSVLDEPYREERRKSSFIFSQIFNSTSGINRLNQFIQAENITKDLNPVHGSIQKLHSRDTDLVTLCENKCFKVLSNKDALFNADGNTNVTSNFNVLGQAIPYLGEFGISNNPESFADYGFRSYFADKNNGNILRLSRDGIEEISTKGMSDFFTDELRIAKNIIGNFDEVGGSYNITLNNKTISFKESVGGWPSRKSFIPEQGVSLNGVYYTFKNGIIWSHNNPLKNTFYGGATAKSSVKLIFNDSSSKIKNFKAISYEGDTSWQATKIVTDNQEGVVTDFKEKEGIYYNFIKGVNNTWDGALQAGTLNFKEFSTQGIGNLLSISGDDKTEFVLTVSENND
jgi:hypothetical protein